MDLTPHRKFRSLMMFDESRVHLNNAGLCPVTRSAVEAAGAAMIRQATEGFLSVPAAVEGYESARRTIARLVGADPAGVAHFPTCSAAISAVAFGFALRPGDEILILDQEYPSNAYPWYAAARRAGATVRTIASNPDLSVDTARMAEAVGPRTRIVAVSWVQSRTGAMTDLLMLSEACRRHGTWLVADVIQGLGAIPFDMRALGVDAVCGGSQKWLCGPYGHGFLALRPERVAELEPIPQGAYTYGVSYDPVDPARQPKPDAHRFEPGCPLAVTAAALEASIRDVLSVGVEAVNAYANALAARLADGIRAAGGTVLSQTGREGLSPIVSFRPRGDFATLSARLKAASITFAERPSEGILRLSPHGFNTAEEIDRAIEAVRG